MFSLVIAQNKSNSYLLCSPNISQYSVSFPLSQVSLFPSFPKFSFDKIFLHRLTIYRKLFLLFALKPVSPKTISPEDYQISEDSSSSFFNSGYFQGLGSRVSIFFNHSCCFQTIIFSYCSNPCSDKHLPFGYTTLTLPHFCQF